MKIHLPFIAAFLGLLGAAEATVVYSNTFDSSANLAEFTVFGAAYEGYPTPLHTISIDAGQLRHWSS